MSFTNTQADGSGVSKWDVNEGVAPFIPSRVIDRSEGHTPVQHDSTMGDGQIVAVAAVVYAIVASISGAAAGDMVQIRDGGGAGAIRFTIVFAAGDETVSVSLGVGAATFGTDVFADYTLVGAGTIYVSVTYD